LDFGADRTSSTTFTVQFPPATAGSALIRLPEGVSNVNESSIL